MNEASLPRPTAARPIQGLFVGSPRYQSPLTPPPPPISAVTPPSNSPGAMMSPGSGRALGSLDDPQTVSELERLADERNINEILQYGYGNGAATLRVTLSPRGISDDAGSPASGDDEWAGSTEDNKKTLGRVFGKLRKKQARPLIITSDDTQE